MFRGIELRVLKLSLTWQRIAHFYSWGRFQKHFTQSFNKFRTQEYKKYSQAVSLFCTFGIWTLKAFCKMLMKLTPGLIVPKHKKTPNNTILYTLLSLLVNLIKGRKEATLDYHYIITEIFNKVWSSHLSQIWRVNAIICHIFNAMK
jgi:hypothetical protein